MKYLSVCGALLGFFMVVGCSNPGPTTEAERPAEEAQAAVSRVIDCSRFDAAADVEAAGSARVDGTTVPMGSALKVRLRNLRAVSPLVPPGRKEEGEEKFAGLVSFRVAAAGTYTVLVASFAWADLGQMNPPRLVEPLSFKWVTLCGKRFKSGVYTLEEGGVYFVQLWDSPDRDLTIMIHPLP